MSGIDAENGTGSQFFFNTEAGLYLPEGQRVSTLSDWGAILSQDPSFLRENYTDLPTLVLRSEKPTYNAHGSIIQDLAKQAKDSFPHMRLLWEYKYGKPKELKELNVKTEVNIPVINFADKEKTIDIESEDIDDNKENK